MIIKHGRHIYEEIHEVRKGLWAFSLDCAVGMLIGWEEKSVTEPAYYYLRCNQSTDMSHVSQ